MYGPDDSNYLQVIVPTIQSKTSSYFEYRESFLSFFPSSLLLFLLSHPEQ